jgi:hypothetical protein
MSIEYSINVAGGVVRVKASGEDESLEQTKKYSLAVLQAAIDTDTRKVLCDERDLDYKLDIFETFELAKIIAENVKKMGRLAIVCKPEHVKSGKFWETVAINRGLYVRFFLSLEEAEEWLKI